jgi:hypothetical protein
VSLDIQITVKQSRDGNYAQCHQEKQSERINCKIFQEGVPVMETSINCKSGLKYSKNDYQ